MRTPCKPPRGLIDLHMHSLYSDDGEFTPEELVRQCKAAGVTVMSIADHNSARANAEAAPIAEALGIAYIPGIEIDCTFQSLNFHLLGYGIDSSSADFAEIERNVFSQEWAASQVRLAKIREMGFSLTEEEMLTFSHEIWTGEMFAEALLNKPEYAEHPLLMPYRPGGARSVNPYVSFYWDFFAQGKPCYAPIRFPSMEESIDVVHRNGGKAVLAHPGVNLQGHEEELAGLLELSLDGIEAFSNYHTEEQARFYLQCAKDRKLFYTCGSDYHGRLKPAIALGHYGRTPSGDDFAPWIGEK